MMKRILIVGGFWLLGLAIAEAVTSVFHLNFVLAFVAGFLFGWAGLAVGGVVAGRD